MGLNPIEDATWWCGAHRGYTSATKCLSEGGCLVVRTVTTGPVTLWWCGVSPGPGMSKSLGTVITWWCGWSRMTRYSLRLFGYNRQRKNVIKPVLPGCVAAAVAYERQTPSDHATTLCLCEGTMGNDPTRGDVPEPSGLPIPDEASRSRTPPDPELRARRSGAWHDLSGSPTVLYTQHRASDTTTAHAMV